MLKLLNISITFFSSNKIQYCMAKMENTENTQVITQIIFEESEKATR